MRKEIKLALSVIVIIAIILVAAFGAPLYLANPPSASPTATPTATPSTSPTTTPSTSPTSTPSTSPTATPTATPSTSPTTNIIVDHLGRTVEVPANPKRIASLHSISTQVIYAIGGKSQLLAIDDASRNDKVMQRIDPAVVNLTGIMGNANSPNVEEIVNLNPDLVIISATDPESTEALANAGLTVITFNFHSRPTIDAVQLIGRAIGKQAEANKLIDYYVKKESIITTRTENMAYSEKPTVMYVSPFSTTGGTVAYKTSGNQAFQHSLITKAGGRNVGENLTGIWFTESAEQIMQWNPTYIITGTSYSGFDTGKTISTVLQTLQADSVLSQLDAVKANKFLILVRLEFATVANCPESIFGLEILAKSLHPTTFADINVNADVKEFYSTFYNCQLTDSEVNTLLNPGGV